MDRSRLRGVGLGGCGVPGLGALGVYHHTRVSMAMAWVSHLRYP